MHLKKSNLKELNPPMDRKDLNIQDEENFPDELNFVDVDLDIEELMNAELKRVLYQSVRDIL
jgi:hypothetical protein